MTFSRSESFNDRAPRIREDFQALLPPLTRDEFKTKRDWLFLVSKPVNGRGYTRGFQDIEGQRFGRFLVVAYAGRLGRKARSGSAWFCQCDCGRLTRASTTKLHRGLITSCGCGNAAGLGNRSLRHGHARKGTRSPEYHAYHHALRRCYCVSDHAYARYGGRGIKFCERWRSGENGKSGFECFLTDIGFRPSTMYSLDRRDSNGDYEPSNCRWATRTQQARNRRNNRQVNVNGQSMSIKDACEALDKKYEIVILRLKRGWSFEDAISKPVRRW